MRRHDTPQARTPAYGLSRGGGGTLGEPPLSERTLGTENSKTFG